MPIAVRVVNERDYAAWLDQAKKKYATDDSRPRDERRRGEVGVTDGTISGR